MALERIAHHQKHIINDHEIRFTTTVGTHIVRVQSVACGLQAIGR
jgi:kynurenine formamidase